VGCAVYTFLSMRDNDVIHPSLTNDGMYILFVLSFAVGVLHSTCVNMNKLPALTLAFNILTLVFLLALARGTSTVATLTWLVHSPTGDPAPVSSYWLDIDGDYFYDALFRGVGQFCFVDTTAGGILVVAGILVCSRRAGCMALAGSITAMMVARYVVILPVENKPLIRMGIYGYNAVGTCVALGGGIFFKASLANALFAMCGAALTVLIQAAVQSLLNTDRLGLPVLTIPFVATAWMMMLSKSEYLVPAGDNEDADLDEAQKSALHDEDAWQHRPEKRIFNESRKRRERRLSIEAGERNDHVVSGTTTLKPTKRRVWGNWLLTRGRPGRDKGVKRIYVEGRPSPEGEPGRAVQLAAEVPSDLCSGSPAS
jgi:urea transporter